MNNTAVLSPESIYPTASVCIVTYNRDDVLVKSLCNLLESTCQPMEILVVDNGHSQELPSRLHRLPMPIQIIYPERNIGCAGLNLAFSRVKGKYVFCFDDDSFPAPDCLEIAIRAFEEDLTLGMIGFKIHDPVTRLPWHDPWWNPDCAIHRTTVFCPGCGLAFRMDPRLPHEMCMPDVTSQAHELSMAAEILRLGYFAEFRPDCIAYHPNNTTNYTGAKSHIGNRNQLKFLIRYADGFALGLLLFSQWLSAICRRQNDAIFAIRYFWSVKRRPLDRRLARQFRDVIMWHIHPRLARFLLLCA
ncbi:MAG: glycosyltransferase family 2 protein [Chthoniobacteraceae bacterium]